MTVAVAPFTTTVPVGLSYPLALAVQLNVPFGRFIVRFFPDPDTVL
jgi:hypothetical protein